jgi:hypothetical protein
VRKGATTHRWSDYEIKQMVWFRRDKKLRWTEICLLMSRSEMALKKKWIKIKATLCD